MRILWLTPGFPAAEHDHNCLPPLQLLAKELLRQGVDLQIVALEYPFHSQRYSWHGAAVFSCNGQNRRWLKLRTLWRAQRFCKEIFDTAKTDVIHSFWLGWASGVGERVAKKQGVPHLTTLMGQDVLSQNWKFQRSLTAERAARLVAVSDFQNDIFEKTTGLRAAYVVPWGVNKAEIPLALPTERPLQILGVGSHIPVKNWEKWLAVVAIVARTNPGLKAELVGDGPERARLENLARRLGLEGAVHFAGHLPRADVLARMRQVQVLLHTARFESFGYVLAEAAMSGCRVVGTPVGAATMLGETAENTEDLAALVSSALSQPVQSEAFVPFTMLRTAEAYLKMYASVGGG